ncbi:hypothetical protein [Bifidobacterium felsineum]|uniref:hypothetical protein n=1 Tax=Bifidobacterium felsineum TaxID=2045440 RepID=UPI001BDCCE35|nr:hypothetical protein [Bifidobacterium felsineum]MBT1164626.1 hypothetical protein [Bifidobacterium felsineum]
MRLIPECYVMPVTAVICGVACKLLAMLPGLPTWLTAAFDDTFRTFTVVGITGIVLVFVFVDLSNAKRNPKGHTTEGNPESHDEKEGRTS